jgi:hypothetical protein
LKGDDAAPGAIGKLIVCTKVHAGSGVKLIRFRQRQGRSVDAFGEDLLNQHSKLGAPIADVALRNHLVADASNNAPQAVTDHRRAQMSDMHLFCDVRGGIVDHHNLRIRDL